ncbi:MAG TPA: transposase [Clostridiales bacterium]|nr:transposase [Clostridiales bacterium]
MFRIDPHVHTRETSPCGRLSAEELVRLYKVSNYDAIVITDHYYRNCFDIMGDLPWEDKIHKFLYGYRNALIAGRKLGVKVFLGMEISFLDENSNDYLVYGMDPEFLIENPQLYTLGILGFRILADSLGLAVFQAHPFRPRMIPMGKTAVHGCEVYNGNPRQESQNHLAVAFAAREGLRQIAGSDCHQSDDVGKGGILLPESIDLSSQLAGILLTRDPDLYIRDPEEDPRE